MEVVALRDTDLAEKRILDCPSGPDAFVAGAARRGFDITGCDPIYAGTREEAMAQGHTDITLAQEESLKHQDQMGGVDVVEFSARKFRALEEFGVDFEAGRATGRYLAASLPNLLFADKSFDLVISANLLFTAPPQVRSLIVTGWTLSFTGRRSTS